VQAIAARRLGQYDPTPQQTLTPRKLYERLRKGAA
jgi:hypothetical protein